MDILEFRGENRIYSNMYRRIFYIENKLYICVENWYQANKTLDPDIYETIRTSSTGIIAKNRGNIIELRPDWGDDDVKLPIMYKGVFNKFNQNEDLKKRLLATDNCLIVEGNYWGDTYWGVCNGKGKNHLGEIIMQVREDLRG